jgi:hypothetical protein
MRIESPVLVLDEYAEKPFRNDFHSWKSPLFVRGQASAQQLAVVGEKHRGKRIGEEFARERGPKEVEENQS